MGFGCVHGGWRPMCGVTRRLGWLGAVVGLTLIRLLPLGVLAPLVSGAVRLSRHSVVRHQSNRGGRARHAPSYAN